MSAFENYMSKVKVNLTNHFYGNENPPIVERMLEDREEMLELYAKGWHPKRVAEFILQKAKEEAKLVSRDNPDLSKEQWAKDFMRIFPKG